MPLWLVCHTIIKKQWSVIDILMALLSSKVHRTYHPHWSAEGSFVYFSIEVNSEDRSPIEWPFVNLQLSLSPVKMLLLVGGRKNASVRSPELWKSVFLLWTSSKTLAPSKKWIERSCEERERRQRRHSATSDSRTLKRTSVIDANWWFLISLESPSMWQTLIERSGACSIG